jgi:hypothetical protein
MESGLKAAASLCANEMQPDPAHTPHLACSVSQRADDIIRAKDDGIPTYIIRPVHCDSLTDRTA